MNSIQELLKLAGDHVANLFDEDLDSATRDDAADEALILLENAIRAIKDAAEQLYTPEGNLL